MKKFILLLIAPLLSYSQACNLDCSVNQNYLEITIPAPLFTSLPVYPLDDVNPEALTFSQLVGCDVSIQAIFFDEDELIYNCAGYSEFNSLEEPLVIKVYGDNPDTPEKDGYYWGEEITLWFCINGVEAYGAITINNNFDNLYGDCSYYSDGLSCVLPESPGVGTGIIFMSNPTDFSCAQPPVLGCTDPSYSEYNPIANVYDGSCETLMIYGCTDSNYLEYDISATIDDGSCETFIIYGCTDPLASCNFNSLANADDGSCQYFESICDFCQDMNGDGIDEIIYNDSDGDGVCDADEIVGCTNEDACNYDSSATDDGDCNFVDGICDFCQDMNGDGIGEIIDNDSDDDGICNDDELGGCTNPDACNYNPQATEYDGSCTCLLSDFISPICYVSIEGENSVIYWDSFNGDCDFLVYEQTSPNTWETYSVSNSFNCIGYNIYRENPFGEYEMISTIESFDESLFFIDVVANPLQQSYSYLLTALDDCGNETVISEINKHKTIHLSSNLGINGEINLLWNAYEGFNYDVFEVWRNNNGGNFELIGQVSTDNFTYSDLNPPVGQNQYYISVTQTESCDEINPNGRVSINSSQSNQIALDITQIYIDEFNSLKKLIKVVDVLGRDIDKENKDALLLYIYNDGSVEKKYIEK